MLRFIIAFCFAPILLVGFSSISIAQDSSWPQQPRRPYGIPEASLPSTPEETAWWAELRKLGNDLKFTRDPGDKQKKRFLALLRNGESKSYKPPVPDARAVFLSRSEPTYTEEARGRGIKGTIILQVQLLADGNVGDVKVIKDLGGGLDEHATEAARKTVFLPAVKNREFVSTFVRFEMSFNIY